MSFVEYKKALNDEADSQTTWDQLKEAFPHWFVHIPHEASLKDQCLSVARNNKGYRDLYAVYRSKGVTPPTFTDIDPRLVAMCDKAWDEAQTLATKDYRNAGSLTKFMYDNK